MGPSPPGPFEDGQLVRGCRGGWVRPHRSVVARATDPIPFGKGTTMVNFRRGAGVLTRVTPPCRGAGIQPAPAPEASFVGFRRKRAFALQGGFASVGSVRQMRNHGALFELQLICMNAPALFRTAFYEPPCPPGRTRHGMPKSHRISRLTGAAKAPVNTSTLSMI